jgi:uncharacterized protein with LGFP repeats
LRDTRIWIDTNRNIVPGAIRERYDALDCRPGLPESKQLSLRDGSQQLFRKGGIFHNDDADVTVWLRGAVFDEYDAVGTGRGVLGLPTTGVVDLDGGTARRAIDCASCSRVNFEGGRIYYTSGLGAHALWGRILDTYLAESGPAGSLGFPTSRVRRLDGGGQRASFEHGSIVCPQGESCSISTS